MGEKNVNKQSPTCQVVMSMRGTALDIMFSPAETFRNTNHNHEHHKELNQVSFSITGLLKLC